VGGHSYTGEAVKMNRNNILNKRVTPVCIIAIFFSMYKANIPIMYCLPVVLFRCGIIQKRTEGRDEIRYCMLQKLCTSDQKN
jgi:ABC-type transport system involved in cytochrome bd biosynthesis fused ATPase/permease subunit